jgi:formylglycine-generating enzyme required for sulfatase activity
MAFCAWLNQQADAPLRFVLPSEAQWEFAARGTDGRHFPWGDEEPDATRVWFGQDAETEGPSLVGAYPAGRGPFGHQDLIGNVWEWCADMWNEKAYEGRMGLTVDPLESGDGDARVMRGASYWCSDDGGVAAAVRLWVWSWVCDGGVGGFRVAASPRARRERC